MVVINDKLYVPVRQLVKEFGFSQSQLDKKCSEFRAGAPSYENMKGDDPTYGRGLTLIAYDSIPAATRAEKKLPEKDELLKKTQAQAIAAIVSFNTDAYNYFLATPATAKIAKQKAEEASWLIAIAKIKLTQCRDLGFDSKETFTAAAIACMNVQAKERSWHAFKLNSVRELRQRITPFKKFLKSTCTLQEACASLVSKRNGNANAQKIEYDQQALLVQLYSDANAKPNFEQVWMMYTRRASQMCSLGLWEQSALISPSTVRAYLMKPGTRQLWYEARHGYQEYRNVFDPVVQRQRPTYANALWVIDGTPLHQYFQHLDKGKYFRWNIFTILDAHSQCLLGFWISDKEDTASVLGALRSACLVTGNMPVQVLYDNGSAITSYRAQHAIDAISVVSFPAKAGNARSKVVEGWFHWYNENVQKFRSGFTHNPFAARLDNRPNREALALAVKENRLTLASNALDQIITDLNIANNIPRPFLGNISPLAAYRKSVEQTASKQRRFSEAIDIEAFYTEPGEQKKIRTYHEGKPTTVSAWVPQLYPFTNRGIDITINGQPFTYDVEDPAFRATHIGQKFSVRFEPNHKQWSNGQPDRLLLYLQGKPLAWGGVHMAALPKQLVPMAVADYTEGTRAQLNERLTNKAAQREMMRERFTEMVEHTKANGTHVQVITENAYDKEVLQNTERELLNQIMEGKDYSLSNAPLDGPPDDTEDSPSVDVHRKYDKPLPLDDETL